VGIVERLKQLLIRSLSIADEPSDDDDTRLRKRVGVAAGYLTVVAPLTLPIQVPGQPAGWLIGGLLALYSVGNLALLVLHRRFERYVVALIASGVAFVPLATIVGGGLTGSTTGVPWAFLVPAYAILALGPSRATPWFLAFLATVVFMVVIDPLVVDAVGSASYADRVRAIVFNGVVPLSIAFLLLRWTDVRRRAAERRADELLTNAIPRAIADRMRHGESRIAETYDATSVLFADIVGFTPFAQRTDPARLVDLLDGLFSRFDQLSEELGVEKVKTIGDAFMAVAGAPERRADHAIAAIELGRAMVAATDEWRTAERLDLEVRVGIASGPVVAGVIGRRRILFDLWGDTVNTASRMESNGLPGRLQVASSTELLARDRFSFEPRAIDVKGLGALTAYLLVEGPVDGPLPVG
jgi:adenylate cyclase